MYSAWIFNPEKKYLAIIPWYKLTNYCCILTYSIVIYKRYLCDENINKNEFESNTLISYILKTENVQLIISAFLWTVTEESFFKLVPFAIYATLNLSCFLVFEAYPQTQFSISLAPFISFIKNPCLIFSAFIDIFIIGLLFHESFKKNSYYVFFLYSFIWCLKMDNSEASRIALFKILKVVDIIFRNQMVPKKINQSWLCFRMKILRLLSISNSGNFIDSTNRPDFYSDGTEGKVEQIVS
ncbi:hypothetical protein C6P40_004776 [Pichia californica]|uniref:Uncharacterized protein n=1 Tax=Pichia californica TaxID=460514 RepID=A0A9P6WP03_9ASCO|nr:hypothetical protein C6P40_004776 [[Candida] californica]